ncbi:MAG: hypothetical protein ACI8PZ_000927 [Myxococcota bacterium]
MIVITIVGVGCAAEKPPSDADTGVETTWTTPPLTFSGYDEPPCVPDGDGRCECDLTLVYEPAGLEWLAPCTHIPNKPQIYAVDVAIPPVRISPRMDERPLSHEPAQGQEVCRQPLPNCNS